MKLPRPPRPSPRRLGVALALLGALAGLAFLVLPMEAALDDDPLLGLLPFSPALGQAVTTVDCGAPVSNFGRRSDDLSLASLARDGVCRDAAAKRAATAAGDGGGGAVLGLGILVAEREKETAGGRR
ncbi:MAG: hypothetical protein ACR2HM_02755, partial [Acidimicrobiales bacterium]